MYPYGKEWVQSFVDKPSPYEDIKEEWWADNAHLLLKENYPVELIDSEGLPLAPVEGRIPLDSGATLVDFRFPDWWHSDRVNSES